MLKTKPVEIISVLSSEELKDMAAFIRSPYFTTNKNLIKLFDIIKKDMKKFLEGRISEEKAFSVIFPGKEYNYGIMKNLISALAALCEEFLVINSVRNKPLNRYKNRVLLADEYDTRQLDRYYDKTIRAVSSELDEQHIDNYYYSDRALAEESKYFFYSSRADEKSLEDAIYKEMIYGLCEFYRRFSRNMWKIHINIDNVNSKYEKDFLSILPKYIDFENLAGELKGINEKDYNYIKLNTLMIKLLVKGEDTKPFYELKQLIYDTIEGYENYERYSILTKAISYCSTAHRAGKDEFMSESLEMRKFMMEKVKFNHGGLGPFNFQYFTETVMMFIHLKDVEGADNFLEKYGDAVGAENRDTNYYLSKAYIMEARGKYKDSIAMLAKIRNNDTEISIRMRRLYSKLYYNMNEFEAGLDAVNAFRAYVKGNDELTAQLKERYLNSLYFTEKVFKIKSMPENYTTGDVEKIHTEMNSRNRLMNQWLDEKLTELKKIVKSA